MFMDKAAAPKLAARGLVSYTGSDGLHAVESGVRRCDAVEPSTRLQRAESAILNWAFSLECWHMPHVGLRHFSDVRSMLIRPRSLAKVA